MTYDIQPFDRQHREAVLDLLFYSRRQHTHFDWYSVGRWLEMDEGRVMTAWHEGHLVGVFGISAPFNDTSWVRLLAIDNEEPAPDVLRPLWEALAPQTYVPRLYLLVVNRWLLSELPPLGFRYQEEVVMLNRVGIQLPPLPDVPFNIKNAYLEHLTDMVNIDHQAFAPPWQMPREDIRIAQRQSASCTVAEYHGRIVGYHISTRYQNAAHLARVAVLPEFEGRGVGSALLHHMIDGYNRRGVRAISVNTQESNTRSQSLYMHYGFRRNGYDLPVWELK